jgi:transcription-repair coupling factor (superfamily II helicase)
MSSAVEHLNLLQETLKNVASSAGVRQLIAAVERGERIVSVAGAPVTAARALILAILERETKKRFVVVTQTNRELETWERDLCFWETARRGKFEADAVLSLPASESDPYAGVSPHAETLERRALALWQLAHGRGSFVIAASRALARRTVAPDELKRQGAILTRAADYSPEVLIEQLVASGYKREDPVNAVGEFSMRGGILDVWSPLFEQPVRVEFFGDTIDSIRAFDPETQLSVRQLKQIEIVPMREFAATSADFRFWAEVARERFNAPRFARALADRTKFADEGETFAGWEWLFSIVRNTDASAFDYLRDCVFVFDEPSAIETFLSQHYEQLAARFAENERADEIGLRPEELYLTPDELRARINDHARIELRALGRSAAAVDEMLSLEAEQPSAQIGRERKSSAPLFLFSTAEQATEIEIRTRAARRYHGRISDLAHDLKRRGAQTTLFVLPSIGVAERIAEMLREYDIASAMSLESESGSEEQPSAIGNQLSAEEDWKSAVGSPQSQNLGLGTWDLGPSANPQCVIAVGNSSSGFELPDANLVVHIETDLFDEAEDARLRIEEKRPKTKDRKSKSKTAAFLSDFRDLKPGDYVVHVDHGIARFGGLQTLELSGRKSEFMLLIYADEAKLYVPVERLDLVQRYSSAEGHEPTLDRLGGLGWQKTKAKAKRAMRDMADELLKLYAERKLVKGYAFAADTPWQREFEDGFPYQLTPDQETAIEDVKSDMEQQTPMDRLLCGDVGYGKTEVAMRAAFKAVMESKQVAVLTPTTVLAYQHFETFRARFAAFPVKVELLSRFRTPKEQKEIIKQVESGEIDILIGTHRILSKDIAFRDLGLVVVDEEQRFGVAHKERLKQLKKRVDVLTLSATPIPRTLNMSLMGLRDMSVIETPPRDRLAINTQVVPFSESVIKSAIELELGRGGQTFFIHNRVETIDSIAALVQRIVPHARLCVAHGQMNEREMEQIMLDFVAYKYDVLVATTIIENGIDIPRANTIIINRADNYGLAQLYQLRGRVGRSNRRAYAYLLIPSEQSLTPIARRRLAAIREFSDLGAGFRVAALDLELRGAGNLLGGQQSGHLDALGFDLYTQMLERTVAELRGEEIADETSVSLNLGVDVSIPEDYIGDMGQRLRTYKRIASARDDETLERIRAEIADRYGRAPASVENLFEYSRLRRTAEALRVISIDRTPQGFAVKFSERARIEPQKLMDLIAARNGASFSPSGVLRIELSGDEQARSIEIARDVLQAVAAKD